MREYIDRDSGPSEPLVSASQILGFLAAMLLAFCYFLPLYQVTDVHGLSVAAIAPTLALTHELVTIAATVASVLALICERCRMLRSIGIIISFLWLSDIAQIYLCRFPVTIGHGLPLFIIAGGLLIFAGVLPGLKQRSAPKGRRLTTAVPGMPLFRR